MKPISISGCLLCVVMLTGCKLATIKPLDPETGKALRDDSVEKFDADAYARGVWDTRLLPTFQQEAVEWNSLWEAFRADSVAAAAAFGYREGSRPYSFIVKGRARIVSVDTSSRVGLLRIDVAPYDGLIDASLQIGPVIRGTALRDALSFIQFNQFSNQLDYAEISTALHRRLLESVTSGAGTHFENGGDVFFSGAFTQTDQENIRITPVILGHSKQPVP